MRSGPLLSLIAAAAVSSTGTAAPAGTAAPDAAGIARCASIAARDARFECYDAVERDVSTRSSAAAPRSSAAPISASAPISATAPVSSTAPASSADLASATTPENFGLTPVQKHTVDLGPKAIAARIAYLSSDNLGRTVVVLDSGQSWSVTDDDGWLSPNEAVTIKKAALGSFILKAPSNHTYHVRRLK